MIVTTIYNDKIQSIVLPEKKNGQFEVFCYVGNEKKSISNIEGINDEWVLKSSKMVKVIDGYNNPIKSTILHPSNIYILLNENNEKIYVFTEPVTEDRQVFSKYLIEDGCEIFIGRSENNDICYQNKVVSSRHAKIILENKKWSVQDLNSTNGTFVNGIRIAKTDLKLGDVIYVMGLKIVVGKNFIAINNPDGCVRISESLYKYIPQMEEKTEEDYEYELIPEPFFYRSPRFKRDINKYTLKIDSPPSSPISEELPWPLVMGSSMAMGMMSVVTLITAAVSHNTTSMVMGGSMLVGTVLLPTVTKLYEKKRKRKKENLRQKKYRAYLDKMAAKINDESQLQEEILNENFATIQECENRIIEKNRNLWERGYGQNDFLRVRLGYGEGNLNAEISYSDRHFSLDDDNLREELYSLCESDKTLHNIPITYSMFENYISGIIGQKKQVIEFAKGLIIQLAALYSYDEVKFVCIYDESEKEEFEFVKWIPHIWSDDKNFRFIARNANEVKEISAYFENIIEEREHINESEINAVKPYYIIFDISKNLGIRTEVIKKILIMEKRINISIVTFFEELKDLPKECSMIVSLDGNTGKLFDKNDISGNSISFVPDIYVTKDPLDMSVKLANTILDNTISNAKLPSVITFMQLFGVGKVEHLNVLTRWKENNPTKTLQTPVGIDIYGETFMLDLHEKFHGPHGLVAGMTGSGKSEFIITYILSLAVNYHPYEVAFILIDYKGGGMAKSFEHLPHTAGIITNLDGAAINRSLVSIQSELKRRQEIFAQTSKLVNVSNIDIYKYQKLYREGKVSEPLQHLFIISDEFAELKTQQPDFMTQLVSAARIGRSLGVHLILATQKPSGVVDDQIWSNSRFRVCLKVQERADSMDMLKRPDAAELTDTGRFFLQVGYNELFELGQSAWAGAPYNPAEKVVKEQDDSVVVVDTNGHAIKQVKLDKGHADSENKQLDVITKYIRSIADSENIKVKPLWLDPIPGKIYVEDIKKKYGISSERYNLMPVIGEYDDPARQRQCELKLPISKEGNAIVYGVAGSGKTTFVNVLMYSLIKEHSPEEVNIYALDFASETLRAFAKAPHVGEIILSYEAEKVSNLFKMLLDEIKNRKKLFVDYGGDYENYIKESNSSLPSIVVIINNFSAFTENYEEKEEAVSYLTREGTKYGIYFVITALGTGAVKFRLAQNFKQQLVLQMNDDSEYSSIIGKNDGLIPSKFKGRGLIRMDELYEFQLANLTREKNLYSFIRNMCEEEAKEWKGIVAKKVPILPEKVDINFLNDYIDINHKFRIPIGVEKDSLNVHYYPFDESYINIITSTELEYQKFITCFLTFINQANIVKGVVLDGGNILGKSFENLKVCTAIGECEKQIDEIFITVRDRNNAYKEAIEAGKKTQNYEPFFIVINSLATLRAMLSDEKKEKLSLILEKGSSNYNITIIVAEQCKKLSEYSFEKWYKTNASSNQVIWVGSGITEQYLIKPNKKTPDMYETITDEFGYSLIKGKCKKIKLLSDKEDYYDE